MASSITLLINESVSITNLIVDAYGNPASSKQVVYSSSNPSVATLANSGTFVVGSIPQNSVSVNTINAVGAGTAIVTITLDGGLVVDPITVIVNAPIPNSITTIFGTPIPH
jgi:uncharacterized protein YjdB